MSLKLRPGFSAATPYLIVADCAAAIAWYTEVFDAVEIYRLPGPGGAPMHLEFEIGGARLMMGAEMPQMGGLSPKTLGGTPVSVCLYVEDADASCAKVVEAGGTLLRPVEDQFYGDRSGSVEDPFGHRWVVGTFVEEVSLDEMLTRMAKMFGGG